RRGDALLCARSVARRAWRSDRRAEGALARWSARRRSRRAGRRNGDDGTERDTGPKRAEEVPCTATGRHAGRGRRFVNDAIGFIAVVAAFAIAVTAHVTIAF